MIGQTLAHYEILDKLGSGGMGDVYRARDTKLKRDVAIKVLPEAYASNRERMARFEREAQVLASLNHPNIASIYGLEKSEGVFALVLELVEGQTLGNVSNAAHSTSSKRSPSPSRSRKGSKRRTAKASSIVI